MGKENPQQNISQTVGGQNNKKTHIIQKSTPSPQSQLKNTPIKKLQQNKNTKSQVEIILQNQLNFNNIKNTKKPKTQCIEIIDDSDQQQTSIKNKHDPSQQTQRNNDIITENSQNKDQIKIKLAQQIIDIEGLVNFVPVYRHKNYKSHIKQVLLKFAGKNPEEIDLDQLAKAITYFREEFMVHRQNKIIVKRVSRDLSFQIMNNFHASLAKEVFSKLTQFIIEKQDDIQVYKIPIFEANRQFCYSITKWQALFIMCSMTMCLIIQQNSDHIGKMYRFTHFVEFTSYFSSNQWKTRCILQYLKTQLNNYYDQNPNPKALNNRMLTIKRVICPVKAQKIIESQKQKNLKNVNVPNDDVTVDDYYKELKLCHTNEVLGGGQALGGLSQEDIFFSAHTELHILLVLCEQMNISDCIHLVGFRKYFRIQRTKYEITFDGQDHDYPLELDEQNRIKDYICFVNHPKILRQHFRQQFKRDFIDRELAIYYGAIKSFLGIPHVKISRIVSGHWACLIQWGDPRKKITSLWIASSMNNKDLTFCPYGQFRSIYDKDFFYNMKQKNVIKVYQSLLLAGKKMMIFRDNLHVFMLMMMDQVK